MNVLGAGGSGHDWSTCLIKDGRTIVAVDEERVTGNKYGIGASLLDAASRRYCLQAAGLAPDDIDHLVACDLVPPPFYFAFRQRTTVISHHLAHAYSCFIPSPFDRAAILIADNSGSIIEGQKAQAGTWRTVETITYAVGDGKDIEVLDRVAGRHFVQADTEAGFYQPGITDDSLGGWYRTVSLELGLSYFSPPMTGPISEDGKTMGLAAYGTDRYLRAMREFVELLPQGRVRIDVSSGRLSRLIRKELAGHSDHRAVMACKADIAHAAQDILEECLLHCARHLRAVTGAADLCMAGGVMLNCVANRRVKDEAGFSRVFIQPAAGDNGTALGSALYGVFAVAGYPVQSRSGLLMDHAYLGRDYGPGEIDAAVAAAGDRVVVRRLSREQLELQVARLIAGNRIVAWFDGGSEFGPRALGHRSILANPCTPGMKDLLNARVKHREPFRPFAPSVLAERASELFAIDCESPFMLLVADVLRPDLLPSITHEDGTARLQTVAFEQNPSYYRMIQQVEKLTGVPAVLNTSFNVAGKPIVETPGDALDCLLSTEIDVLAIGECLVWKVGTDDPTDLL